MTSKRSHTPDAPNGQRRALLLGINEYQDAGIPNLQTTAAGAAAIHELLCDAPAYGFSPPHIQLKQPTSRLDLLQACLALGERAHSAAPLVYLAGRAALLGGQPYLLPPDAQSGPLFADTAIAFSRLAEILCSPAGPKPLLVLNLFPFSPQADEQKPAFAQGLLAALLKAAADVPLLAAISPPAFDGALGSDRPDIFAHFFGQSLAAAARDELDRASLTLQRLSTEVLLAARRWAQETQPDSLSHFHTSTNFPSLSLFSGDRPESNATEKPAGNPIHRAFPSAVVHPDDFIGRQQDLNWLLDKTAALPTLRTALVIKGERCIGKTSLLNQVRLSLSGQHPYHFFLPVPIEPNSAQTYEDFARDLWYGLQFACLQANIPLALDDNPFPLQSTIHFKASLRRLQAQIPPLTFVALIDEFDKLATRSAEDGPFIADDEYARIAGLIHTIIEQTDFPILFIFSVLEDLPVAGRGSPLPAHKLVLQPMDEANQNQLWQHLLGDFVWFEPGSQRLLKHLSGGHPFLIKLLAASLYEHFNLDARQRRLTTGMVREAANVACASPLMSEFFADVYDRFCSDAERNVLLWLAEKDHPHLTKAELAAAPSELATAAAELAKRGYLQSRQDGSYELRAALLAEWLRTWSRFPLEEQRLRAGSKASANGEAPNQPALSATLIKQGLCLDLTTRKVYIDGQEIEKELTEHPWRALCFLAEHAGVWITKDKIIRAVYPNEVYVSGAGQERMYQLISRLRTALGDQRPYRFLENQRGGRYRLNEAHRVRTPAQSPPAEG